MNDMRTIRWGILGPGLIAQYFARDFAEVSGAQLVAVGARSLAKAEAFASEHGIARVHGSIEGLLADPEVDAVYISSTQNAHHEHAIAAIEAGKATLVEKPFALNATQAEDIATAARARGVFCMEAMWTRFLPHMAELRRHIARGAIGPVRAVHADHSQWFDPADGGFRLFDAQRGGGALLDLGVYPVSFAHQLLGDPVDVAARAVIGEHGVDGQTAIIETFADGSQAVLTTSILARGGNRATIAGESGRIELDEMFYKPGGFTIIDDEGSSERFDVPVRGLGLHYEVSEVNRCLAAGLTESPLMPLEETVSVLGVLDAARRQIGLAFPGE